MGQDGDRRQRDGGRRLPWRAIDGLNGWMGRAAGWLLLAMVLLGAFNAVARYLGRFIGLNLSSNAYLEAQWYLFSLVFLLGGAYTLLRDGHVRVDLLYGRLSRRSRALVELAGTLFLLVPFAIFVLWLSWPAVRNSWAVLEGSPDPGGLPRYPIRAAILVGFGLLLLQGVARIPRLVAEWRGGGGAGPAGGGESNGQIAAAGETSRGGEAGTGGPSDAGAGAGEPGRRGGGGP